MPLSDASRARMAEGGRRGNATQQHLRETDPAWRDRNRAMRACGVSESWTVARRLRLGEEARERMRRRHAEARVA
jgi:hypothetical protein